MLVCRVKSGVIRTLNDQPVLGIHSRRLSPEKNADIACRIPDNFQLILSIPARNPRCAPIQHYLVVDGESIRRSTTNRSVGLKLMGRAVPQSQKHSRVMRGVCGWIRRELAPCTAAKQATDKCEISYRSQSVHWHEKSWHVISRLSTGGTEDVR